MDTDTIVTWAVWATCLTGLIVFVVTRLSKLRMIRGVVRPTEDQLEALDFSRQQETINDWPRCVCGDIATHSVPKLVRSRTGWLRSFFAAPPSYKRKVMKATERDECHVCETHAHVADAMTDKFIYHEIRDQYAQTNEKIAVRAAAFEKEGLIDAIRESLTDKQKKNARKVSPLTNVRQLTRSTGTDGRLDPYSSGPTSEV